MRLTYRRTRANVRGAALVEVAIVTPVLLLVLVGMFEVARAFQTWQVLTNAAREGARAAIVPNSDSEGVVELVRRYMSDGQLRAAGEAAVSLDDAAVMVVNGREMAASRVTVEYPFQFVMLQPVIRLVVPGSEAGAALTMTATSLMRNEAQ